MHCRPGLQLEHTLLPQQQRLQLLLRLAVLLLLVAGAKVLWVLPAAAAGP
jgi:hypothetical protein